MWAASGEMCGKHVGKGVEIINRVGWEGVNHSRAGPLRVVGKALQKTASWDVYRATCVM